MKKLLSIIMAIAVALGVCGCGSAFSDEYYFSEPFRESTGQTGGTETEVRNESTLKRAIMELIYAGETEGQFRFGSYAGSLMDDLAAVCLEIKTSTPIGAYAVENITYDTSRIVSYYTADISIKYRKTPQEIASVEELSGLGGLDRHLISSLENRSTGTVVKLYSSASSEEYIRQFISEAYYSDPLLVAMEPEVDVSAYPETGPERIYVISFRYDASPVQLESMDKALTEKVEELVPTLEAGDSLATALRCADFLGELCSGEKDSGLWRSTAYGALLEGSADSFGLAMAYKALCDRLGIECFVVRGEQRGGEGRDCAWNIIGIDGGYYHVDLSRFYAEPYSAFLLSDTDIWGEYDWERDYYPACSGELGPEDVFEIPAVQPDEPPHAGGDEPDLPEESPSASPEQPDAEEPQPGVPGANEPVK